MIEEFRRKKNEFEKKIEWKRMDEFSKKVKKI